jgi:hypothetical protein
MGYRGHYNKNTANTGPAQCHLPGSKTKTTEDHGKDPGLKISSGLWID